MTTMYDESIEVCDEEDDEEEYELLASHRRPGVSPVKRGPFNAQQHQQQRPTRSFIRASSQRQDSFGMSDEGSPAPAPIPPPHNERKKSLSSKDFVEKQPPSRQHSQDDGKVPPGGKQHENLMSLASNYAKKLMSSGSDKKEKPPADVMEAAKREPKGSGHEPKRPRGQNQPLTSSSMSPSQERRQPQPPPPTQQHHPPPQSRSEDDDEEDDEDEDEYDEVNVQQIEGLLNRVEKPRNPFLSPGGANDIGPRPPSHDPPPRNMQPPPQGGYLQNRHHSHRVLETRYDRGGGGDPYSNTVHGMPQQAVHQFHPGFGPATANLMSMAESPSESDPEISISEGEMDLSRMNEIMEMYSNQNGIPHTDPLPNSVMPMPNPPLANLAMVDEEVLEHVIAQRKVWEFQLDLKREALRRRTLVMSDYQGVHTPGCAVYNPQNYEHLNVSPDIKELFQYITRYEPPAVGSQMDVKLKPFIPEYYPSVGDIDAFIKVLHPEIPDDNLGIKHLDEPSPFQSDPSVLDLRLRALAKQSSTKSVVVKKIDNVGKNAKIIENWIKDISDLHRSKPSPSVHYSKPMPDIDALIQEWPPQVEELLKNLSLPSADLDCDLPTYVDLVCNLLDIPVYKSRIQSLHVLCTLYATYKHFNQYAPLGGADGGTDLDALLPLSNSVRLDDSEVDRLQIN